MNRFIFSVVTTSIALGGFIQHSAEGGVVRTSGEFQNFSGSGTNPNEKVRLQQFDTLGGRRVLDSVEIHYGVDSVIVDLFGENFRSTPIATTVNLNGAVRFDGPPSADFSVPISASRTYSLARSDGVPNSGLDYFREDVVMTGRGIHQADPLQFLGTGSVDFGISGGGPVTFTQSITGPRFYDASFNGSITIEYRFSSLNAAPEPGAAVLFATGIAMFAGAAVARNRRITKKL